MSVDEERERLVSLVRPQLEDGESIVAALGHLMQDTPESKKVVSDAESSSTYVSVSDSPDLQSSERAANAERVREARIRAQALMANVPLVVTDRRVFVMACDAQVPVSVKAAVPRDQVTVERVKAAKTKWSEVLQAMVGIKPYRIRIVIDGTRYKLTTNRGYRNDLLAVAAAFAPAAH